MANVEQQPADRVGGVVHRPAQAELDLAAGKVLDDCPGVWQGTGEAVELGHDQGVARPAGGQRFPETWPFAVRAGQALVDVRPLRRHTQSGRSSFLLSGRNLEPVDQVVRRYHL